MRIITNRSLMGDEKGSTIRFWQECRYLHNHSEVALMFLFLFFLVLFYQRTSTLLSLSYTEPVCRIHLLYTVEYNGPVH